MLTYIKMTRKENNNIVKSLNNVLQIHPFGDLFSKILEIQVISQSQISNCLISTSGIQLIDQILNEIKTTSLKILVKILTPLLTIEAFQKQTPNEFSKKFLKDYFSGIFQSLSSFCNSVHSPDQFNLLIQDDGVHECLVYSLRYLTKVLKFSNVPEVYDIYAKYMKNLIVDVCLFLMMTTQSELDLYQSEPEGFFLVGFQTCDSSEKIKILKPQAGLFLETICEKIDGAMTHTMNVLFKMTEFSIHMREPQEIPTMYRKIVDHKDSFLITKADLNVRIETCVIALAMLHKQIMAREDMCKKLKKLLSMYSDFFLHYSDCIIRCRVCLLLTYYFEILFLDENYEVLYKHYLNFLFDNMTSFSDGFNGLQVQATDCISYLFHQKSLVSRFDSYINNPETNILMRLIDYTMYAKLEKYFDIIYDIVTLYEVKLINDQNSSLSLIRALVARYMQEEEEGSNEPNIIISKIWNILIAMAERKKYVMALLPQLEESLTPLFKSMTFDSIVLYEDEVMTWMNSVMKITKEPTPLISELFKLVPQFLEKDGYVMSKHVLEALNLLITYDTKQIAINEDSIHELLSMAIRVLSPSKESATEVDSAHGALLLQLIIQNLSPKHINVWEVMIEAVIVRYSTAQKNFLKAKLAGVILMSFLNNFQMTQEILLKNEGYHKGFYMIFEDLDIYKGEVYDRKLFVITMCELFEKKNMRSEISDMLPKIFEAIVIVLGQSKDQIEASHYKKEEEENFEIIKEENCYDNDDESQVKSVISNLLSELKIKDEFAAFKQLCMILKDKAEDTLKFWISLLPESRQAELQDIIAIKNIGSEMRKIVKCKK